MGLGPIVMSSDNKERMGTSFSLGWSTGTGARWTRDFGIVVAATVCLTAAALPQAGSTSSSSNAYPGSVTAVKTSSDVMKLSFDDAIRLGLENNLALTLARDDQKISAAERLVALNPLLPNISLEGQTGVHQYNLAAQGFTPAVGAQFAKLLHLTGGAFSTITRADVTTGQANFSLTLFNWALIDEYRAAKVNETVALYNTQSSRGLVVLNVGNAYLEALAAGAQVDYAEALLKTDQTLLDQAVAEHQAGTVANLEELRARVQFQSQQQSVIATQANFEKAKIALVREIGVPAGQRIQLTDTSPYAELEAMSIADAREKAYASRQDYQSMQAQIRSAQLERNAAKHERLPTLSFGGNYGVTGVSGQVFHGTFVAQGQLQVPLFREAKFRGDREVAEAQLSGDLSQFADLRNKIDAQLRDSLLDVQTDSQLVQVARSNVDLATTELSQTTDRFRAGIDDNLPVVEAQATLASAQTTYVQSVYRFNEAKLGLARNLGIIDTQYNAYLAGAK
jgi:outer membrane protein TolC